MFCKLITDLLLYKQALVYGVHKMFHVTFQQANSMVIFGLQKNNKPLN